MSASPIVDAGAGRVRGIENGSVVRFLGIPYASATRFAASGPVSGWAGVRDALASGPAAPQPRRAVATFTHGEPPNTDEECLNLNVYTPSLAGARPVVVWLHGGGFTIGHATASLYDGSRLAARADVVVVSLNYRLGSLGWLWHPGLGGSEARAAGNWGLLDQIAALDWVRHNIASFGGDPGRVALAGQSAGALCAMDLLVSPAAAGLFHRAVLQSPPLGDVAHLPDMAARWAEALSVLGGGRGFDPCLLRSLTAERIVALHEELLDQPAFRGTRGGALPTIDPASLPESPVDAPDASPAVDVLIGSTADEGTFFFNSPWRPTPDPERVQPIVGHLPGVDDAAETIERYRSRAVERARAADANSLLVEIATDALVAGPAAEWAHARARATGSCGGRVYRYRVDHPGAGPVLRATHTVEVPLLFGTWQDGGPGERLAGQAPGTPAVADALVGAWTRFFHGDAPGWAAVGTDSSRAEIGVFGGMSPYSVEGEVDTLIQTQSVSHLKNWT